MGKQKTEAHFSSNCCTKWGPFCGQDTFDLCKNKRSIHVSSAQSVCVSVYLLCRNTLSLSRLSLHLIVPRLAEVDVLPPPEKKICEEKNKREKKQRKKLMRNVLYLHECTKCFICCLTYIPSRVTHTLKKERKRNFESPPITLYNSLQLYSILYSLPGLAAQKGFSE